MYRIACQKTEVCSSPAVLQMDGYVRRQRMSRGPGDWCWRAKNTLATYCCLFWARFYGNHLLCIYVGVKILYLASALLQVAQRTCIQPYCAPTSPARLLMGALARAAYIHQTLPYRLTNISEQTHFSDF